MKKALEVLINVGKWIVYYVLAVISSLAFYWLIFRPDKEE